MSARRAALGFLIAAGALAVVAGFATAKLKTRSDRTTIGPGKNGTATTKCPKGSEAVSGGFATPHFDPGFNGRSVLPLTSKRTHGRKWKTRGYNFSDHGRGKLFSFAYCDTHQPGLQVRSKHERLRAGDPGSATAKCPRGSEAVSGGFASPDATAGGAAVFAFTSKRVSHRRWKVSAYNNDQTDSQRLVAFAFCDKHEPGLRAESKQVMIPLARKRLVTVNCPHGRNEVFGGFAATVDTDGAGPFVFTSKRSKVRGRDWEAAAAGNGAGTHPFKVFVYCK
jgi:hypothetical protein